MAWAPEATAAGFCTELFLSVLLFRVQPVSADP